MQWLLNLKLVLLLTVANGTPVIANKLFGNHFNQPLDCGGVFFDERPVFGPSKTIRGIIFSLMATTALTPLLGFEWASGLWIASLAMAGDLFSSFLKRRLNLPPSSRATGVDQNTGVFASNPRNPLDPSLGALDVLSIVIIFFLGQVILSRLFFEWNIRNRPH